MISTSFPFFIRFSEDKGLKGIESSGTGLPHARSLCLKFLFGVNKKCSTSATGEAGTRFGRCSAVRHNRDRPLLQPPGRVSGMATGEREAGDVTLVWGRDINQHSTPDARPAANVDRSESSHGECHLPYSLEYIGLSRFLQAMRLLDSGTSVDLGAVEGARFSGAFTPYRLAGDNILGHFTAAELQADGTGVESLHESIS
ncbi:hypothetical protein B0H16DRAFT_1445734 [Mycena metata]|uniref:Uncharacterized protein n=1 Tax=Mycena metata TaxID=1033252 RepID=A0AAD7KHA1_9AGAR|nr:hypothetical protein B0H16DRAFT_1445734 [Mycena metata]